MNKNKDSPSKELNSLKRFKHIESVKISRNRTLLITVTKSGKIKNEIFINDN